MKKKINSYKWLALPLGALSCYLVTLQLKNSTEWVEENYTNLVYPFIAKILSAISNPIPFSLVDIFYLVLIFCPLTLILLLFFKKIRFKTAGKFLLNILAATYILFYILWGFNYYREPLNLRLGIHDRDENSMEFVAFLSDYIEDVNKLQCSVDSLDKKVVAKEIEESYRKLAPTLQFKYPMGKRKDKKITFSGFYAKTGITGYFGPFFNEVHVNKKVLPIEYPYVLAHEKAHQLGVTSEAEANFYAWLVCSNCKSKEIRYSGKLFILFQFLRQAYNLEEFKSLVELISPEVKNDYKTIQQHWIKLRNEKMDKTASKVNDAYLKTNNVKAGIKDYRGVVEHVMNFSLDSAFVKQHALEDI